MIKVKENLHLLNHGEASKARQLSDSIKNTTVINSINKTSAIHVIINKDITDIKNTTGFPLALVLLPMFFSAIAVIITRLVIIPDTIRTLILFTGPMDTVLPLTVTRNPFIQQINPTG